MTVQGPSSVRFDASRFARLTEVLRSHIDSAAIPGAVVGISMDGKRAYLESFGSADSSAQRAMQPDSIFRIASMTKPVTVTAALMLMERGLLLLSDPISRFLPQLKKLRVGVESIDERSGKRRLNLTPLQRSPTVQDLMRHTAGFTYGQTGNSLVQQHYRAAALMDWQQTNQEMIAKLADIPLASQPGGTFDYGMSTDVLGRLVEVVAERSLGEFFAEHITAPLGMTSTTFGIRPEDATRLAEPRRAPVLAGESSSTGDPARSPRWQSGGGGLLSTATDYERFCRMLLNGGALDGTRLLSRKSVQLMTANHLPPDAAFGQHTPELGLAAPLPGLGQGYGLGVGVRLAAGLSAAPGSVGDFYWGGATGPYFWVDPAEKLTVVFMLQELDVQKRTRYRALLRTLVYQSLD